MRGALDEPWKRYTGGWFILPKIGNNQRNATLAQLVERLIRNQQVAGSIPAGGSNLNQT